MKVLLARNVDTLGVVGDVVEVKRGYARNYLLPLGIAHEVTADNLSRIEFERKRLEAEEGNRLSGLKTLAEKIATSNVTIEAKASAEGHLFGSVTAAMIAAELSKLGHHLTAAAVRLENPIKQIGVFNVPVHLHTDVEAEARVWVVQSKE
jgi:large subunit ribosomal protein L9